MIELKRCPFCGNIPSIISYPSYAFADDQTHYTYLVWCKKDNGGCGCMTDWHTTMEEAIETWNRRTSNEGEQTMIIIDYGKAKECENPDTYYTCLKCGKCGRKFNEFGVMIDTGGTHNEEDE